ncbi:kinase-like protein [Gigaspora margarita]|uniref:Kinase-like protein n=1 Tax=Gigaspora margarita TaxID=4874 RepID=A0A8H4B2R7_GIGMA|nr:kinase-like protein [Gigaspora margarita]
MENTSEEWLDKAISDGNINFLEYNKFKNPMEIASGGFGKVFKYEWKDGEIIVAFKCLKFDKNLKENIIEDFINELKLLRRVDHHPNIIRFYGITKDCSGYFNMVLQYADDGTLREYLKTNFTRLQWTDKLRIAKEIALGLSFLHDNNIIHRDLHSKNILIHKKKPKIADFGLSKLINEKTSMTSSSDCYGMLAYIEPQCFIIPKYRRDMKSDVYSFGVILWEISSGRPPFQFSDRFITISSISQGKKEIPIEGTPSQYIELYKKCWDNNPANRPESKLIPDILKQQILEKIQIEDQITDSTWDLSNNKCGLKYLNELIDILCNSNTLKYLNLECNNLGDEGKEEKHWQLHLVKTPR